MESAQPSPSTKVVEYEADQLLANEALGVLMIRIGLARNALETQLTLARNQETEHSSVRLRDLICSLVSAAAFTHEAVKLAWDNFDTLGSLATFGADQSDRPRVDQLLDQMNALCERRNPASRFLARSRNKLGFHWDPRPIRRAMRQIVRPGSRGVFLEFDADGRVVHALATNVLARAMFPDASGAEEMEQIRESQQEMVEAIHLVREFFERALIGYYVRLRDAQA